MQAPVPILWNSNLRVHEIQRTPTWYDSIPVTANTWQQLHVPTAGTKFRVLGVAVSWGANYSCAAYNQLTFADGMGAGIWYITAGSIGLTAPSGGQVVIPLSGNGFNSGAVDRALYFKIGTALTAGQIQASAWGCDE